LIYQYETGAPLMWASVFFRLYKKYKNLDYMHRPFRALNMSPVAEEYNYFKCSERNRGIASPSQLLAILQVR